MQADFEKQVAVLETFGVLREEWKADIHALIEEHKRLREDQREKSLDVLTEMLIDLCSYQVSQKVITEEQAKALEPGLKTRFFSEMRQLEAKGHRSLEMIYGYRNLDSEIDDLPYEEDLFDTERWIVWGLTPTKLAGAATAGGAAAGAAVGAKTDVGFLGYTLGMGTILGGVSGGLLSGAGVWLGAKHIAKFKVKGLPIGGFEARYGPIRNRNFLYVVLGRYISLEGALRNRTHAWRDTLQIEEGDLSKALKQLSIRQRKSLHSAFNRLRKQKPVKNLRAALAPLLTVHRSHS
jgi:hypothetical protein